jgi:hypothetical protein
MNSDDLSRKQTGVLFDRIQPMLLYLVKLEKQMAKRKFPPDDELRILVAKARSAVYDLRQDLHQRSASGIPRTPRRRPPD